MRTSGITKSAIAIFVLSLNGYNSYCIPASHQSSAGEWKAQTGSDRYAPEFSLPDLDGEMISSKSLKGKFVVIHFATTWCPFCNAEAPHLEALYREYKTKGVEVFIVDVQEARELVVQRLRDKFNLSFPILLDVDGAVAASFAPPEVLPELSRAEVMLASNLIIDPEGKIRFLSLLDSKNFDAKLVSLRESLDALIASAGKGIANPAVMLMNDPGLRQAQAGKETTVKVSFEIREGLHIQADRVNDPNLIPAELSFAGPEGIVMGKPVFPEYKTLLLEGATENLWVFDKALEVTMPVFVSENKPPGVYKLKGNLRYQACDSRKCFFPAALEFELGLKIE
jgi:peroxiredoxin